MRSREVPDDGGGSEPGAHQPRRPTLPPEDDGRPLGRLGAYHLLRSVGQGGMGEIFLAKRLGVGGFEKTFAIKRMLDSLSGSPEFVAMFFDEARLAARLSHPNIAQIYDFGVVGQHYYLAMEYIAGEDLSRIISHLKQNRIAAPVGIALRIGIDVCAGLEYAHTLQEEGRPLGIIHRDVSPANIMISYQGAVKLLDFGIAKATSRVSGTRTGTIKGKLSFVAPEQVQGLPADPRSDLFSFGIGLYGLLTCHHPFRRPTDMATMHAITQVDAPDPRTFRPDLPAEVAAILLKALARDREARYGSAGEMGAALQSALARLSPGTGAAELGGWLVELFGDGRRDRKTRVPTISQVDLSGLPGVVDPPPFPASVAPADDASGSSLHPLPGRGSRRPGRWLRAAASLGLALVFGAAVVVLAGRARAPAPVGGVGSPASPVVPPASPPSSPPRPVAGATPPAAIAAPLKEEPTPTPTPAPAPIRPRPAPAMRPGLLAVGTLQAVLKRSEGRFTACFHRHAADLPEDQGQVRMELAVVASGKVSVAKAILPAVASGGLAACLEEQARRIRFPRHAEREIRFALPLAYRRGQ